MEFCIVSEEEAKQDPYPYVYVLEDGRARELRESERHYLEETFHGADGGRPYVKWQYEQKDGCGGTAGFCARKLLPKGLSVLPADTAE